MEHAPNYQKTSRPGTDELIPRPSAGPHGMAFQPPAYGISELDAACSQESPGPIQRSGIEGRGVVQRLEVDEVSEAFDGCGLSDYSNGLQPTPQVLKTISQLTTAWESMGKNSDHRAWREKYSKARIKGILVIPSGDGIAKATRVCQDVDYWKARLLVTFEKGEELFKPDVNKILEQHNMLTKVQGIPPVDDRILVQVTMGQGAAADLKKFIFFSRRFSTCSAVAMYNDSNHMGGLFHYAADIQHQHAKLVEMADNIHPTNIRMYVHKTEDFDAIQALFPLLGVTRFEGSSEHYYLYLTNQGNLAFGPDDPGNPTTFLNLTGMQNLPDEIGPQFPLTMYHEPMAYEADFEVLPPYE